MHVSVAVLPAKHDDIPTVSSLLLQQQHVSMLLTADVVCVLFLLQVSMKAVALARPTGSPAWKLRAADVTVSNLSQLTVYNVRRLFANLGCELGDLQKQQSGQPPQKRRTLNATL
jgi:hypothetical protein